MVGCTIADLVRVKCWDLTFLLSPLLLNFEIGSGTVSVDSLERRLRIVGMISLFWIYYSSSILSSSRLVPAVYFASYTIASCFSESIIMMLISRVCGFSVAVSTVGGGCTRCRLISWKLFESEPASNAVWDFAFIIILFVLWAFTMLEMSPYLVYDLRRIRFLAKTLLGAWFELDEMLNGWLTIAACDGETGRVPRLCIVYIIPLLKRSSELLLMFWLAFSVARILLRLRWDIFSLSFGASFAWM